MRWSLVSRHLSCLPRRSVNEAECYPFTMQHEDASSVWSNSYRLPLSHFVDARRITHSVVYSSAVRFPLTQLPRFTQTRKGSFTDLISLALRKRRRAEEHRAFRTDAHPPKALSNMATKLLVPSDVRTSLSGFAVISSERKYWRVSDVIACRMRWRSEGSDAKFEHTIRTPSRYDRRS